ncbi:MAG: DUF4375 domain-containing protein [Verrucomicrobia bacterium]|nr:DUF4375 domain-containing protein [Verrucomicrobiota bacterium]
MSEKLDSDFELVNATFCSLANREKNDGAESIRDIERIVLLVWHAAGIVGNGGFRYFFECGLPLRETAEAYSRIGVESAASVLRNLREMLPGRQVSDDYDERMKVVERIYTEHEDVLSKMEKEFWNTDDLMTRQLAGWIKVHRDVFDAAGSK